MTLNLLQPAAFDPALAALLHDKINGKAKPPGSLGRLEELAVQIGVVQQTLTPQIGSVRCFVFAGDHGMNEDGVSAYPSSVTAAMVTTFLAGRASVNALATACDVGLFVVDAGVDADLNAHPRLIDAKVRKGTRNAAAEAAMTDDELELAIKRGSQIAATADADALVIGEMGIGNTASAALIMHRLAPAALEACIGVGAGHDPAGLARKTDVITRAARRTTATAPIEVLREFGGLEIAMMTGAFLGGGAANKLMIVDGFISSAAALVAVRLVPSLLARLVFAHASAERGHKMLLSALESSPFLDLGLRLGEGSGGVLLAPIVRAAARLMTETAALDDVLQGRKSV